MQSMMRGKTGTSAPSVAFPFRCVCLSRQWRIFTSFFDALGPKLSTLMSVGIPLRRKLHLSSLLPRQVSQYQNIIADVKSPAPAEGRARSR